MKQNYLPKRLMTRLTFLAFVIFCNVKPADAAKFSAMLANGQTLYYEITSAPQPRGGGDLSE